MTVSQRDCQNGRKRARPAKMAASANVVPKKFGMVFACSKPCATKKYFSADFFRLTFKFGLVKCRYKDQRRKVMNSKNLRKRLEKLGYTLGKDIFGWIIISNHTGFEWKYPTLGGVSRFLVDEENMAKITTR